MIEVGNHPDMLVGAVLLHSTESGGFFACGRQELERLVAAAKRGELDPFLLMQVPSVVADGDADFVHAGPPAAGPELIERGTATDTLGVDHD